MINIYFFTVLMARELQLTQVFGTIFCGSWNQGEEAEVSIWLEGILRNGGGKGEVLGFLKQ